ncbi:TrkA C-terminal domain-containing protein, partial [Schnuerera sp.]|uniref:TrkA C-terminal domain-containing protein n=1 Tax=Schnuerera sp. TaxID=2794844 RepID=UPI002BD253A0
GGEGEVTEIIASKDMSIVGKPLYQLGLPKGIIIGAIVHKGEVIIPNGNSIINENDRIIVFSLTSHMPAFNKMIKSNKGGILNGLWVGN